MEKKYTEALSIDPFRCNPKSPVIVKAEGCWLIDEEKRKYFDGSGGSGAVNLYHQHPAMKKAIKEQTEKLLHTGWNVQSDVRLKLIEKLGEFSPFNECAILFTLPGTEAIEAALKVARAYTGRKTVVSFERAFHGKSTGSLALTWREKFKSYAVISEEANVVAPYPILHSKESKHEVKNCLETLEKIVKDMCNEGREPAAFILEPIQTSEGVLKAGDEFLEGVSKIAKETGALLIFDEIYTGFCRTGRKFCASEGVKPDLLVVGKGLANGIPISAVLGNKEILNSLPAGNHSSTFSANPLACAVGNAVLDTMNELKLWDISKKMGLELKEFLEELSKKTSIIKNVRGEGLLLAFDCYSNEDEDSCEITEKFIKKALDNGMILRYGGYKGQTIKFTPPLLMNESDIKFVKECFEKTVKDIE